MARLQVSEDRFRTLFDLMDEGFCIIEMIFYEAGVPTDWRFLEVNPAFEKHAGLSDAVGKRAKELLPDLEAKWFEIYGQVALTGQPIRMEEGSAAMNRWFDLYAFRLGESQEHRIAVVFDDITHRKRDEHEREKLVQSLEFERQRLAAIFENAPAFVAVLRGADLVFEMSNPA